MKIKSEKQGAWSFTLIELMVVISIIGVLAGILLAAAAGVRSQAARSQARAQIGALESALARFQTENGYFPSSTSANPSSSLNPANYVAGSRILFTNLMGRTTLAGSPGTNKAFFDPKADMVLTNSSPNSFLDPWGYAFGYYWDATSESSVYNKAAPDVWSTGGQLGTGSQTNRSKWICNWPN